MNRRGFTIVELLIVIVVIAVLAAITIVAYNGISNRAKASAAQSAAAQATKKVMTYAVDNADQYPASLAAIGVADSGDTSYQYSVNNSVNPRTYCVTATTSNVSYYESSTSGSPVAGACAGHGVNGVAPITNLVKNPRGVGTSAGVGESSGWFTTSGNSDTANVSWNSRSDWHRFVGTTGNRRLFLDLATLQNGQTYTISVLVGNDGAVAKGFALDFCDQSTTNFTINPGEERRISITATRATYDSIYRFVDLGMNSTTDGLLVTDAMVTAGSTLHAFGYGASPNWVWNGTANNSTSTGPPL